MHHPDRPALLFKGNRLSYAELDRESNAFAAALATMGVAPSDRVALCLPNCPQFLIAELGAWKAGAIACPLNLTYSERELQEALSASGAETVVVLNRYLRQAEDDPTSDIRQAPDRHRDQGVPAVRAPRGLHAAQGKGGRRSHHAA